MTLKVSLLKQEIGDTNLYSTSFRRLIEDHLEYIREHSSTTIKPVLGSIAVKYNGDLYGLLIHLRVSQELHWITMRVNNFHSPTDYNNELISLVIPNIKLIKTLLSKYVNYL